MASIGFIGLGAMGLPMAKRLLAAGHALKIAVHKNPAPARELEKLGGVVVASFSEVVSTVDAVISIVPQDEQLAALFLSPGVPETMNPGTLLIEMTTASPSLMREIAAHLEPKGIRVLDAPVSGGVKGAAEGTLTAMCGGAPDVYRAALPILQALGTKLPHVGGMGAGKALKAVNQLLVGINTVAVAEALALARATGVDLAAMREVIASSSGNSAAFGNKFESMIRDDFSPRFTTSLMRKDIGIALAGDPELDLPLATLAGSLYEKLDPDADSLDYSVIATLYKKGPVRS